MDDPYGLYYLWPFVLCLSWAVFGLGFIIVDPAGARALKIVGVIVFIIAAVFALFGLQ